MKMVASIAPLCLLAGCAEIAQPPSSVTGDESYVSVANMDDPRDGKALAAKFCGKYGKLAQYRGTQGYNVVYDCVTPLQK